MLRSINSNTGSTLSSYEANPNNNPSPQASNSISEQYSTPSPSQGTAKIILSEEARKISLKLFAHEASSPLKRDESFFQQEAVAQRKIESASQTFTEVRQVAFDKTSKSYEYPLLNPELGYIYRIRWDR